MTRTYAQALVLVNWKGVFYERYLLHRHVTALEGANGAGKTTVMIAAYVVMLPDMSRLRFTNLGESGATGGDKGIWGRLGEPGRPSYAALDLVLPSGERLVAGVKLERKAEPSVEPTPFIVTELAPEVRLQDLFLLRRGGHDEVPELTELKENVQRLGAACQVFSSTKDYLATLFERGVTPLKLSSEEERRKFNEMLRTSMTGGISRALTTELRSFLLKEETGLGDALTHMKNNLEACRRTRIEVSEAQRLDQEIAGVYSACQRMFLAALAGERARAEELEKEQVEARERAAREEQELLRLADVMNAAKERHARLSARLNETTEQLKAAEHDRARRGRARELARALDEVAQELAEKDAARRAALETRELKAAERAARTAERDRCRDDYEKTTRGLAHVQTGLEELHRHAHAYRLAKERLEQVRALLGEPEFSPDDAATRLEATQRLKAELDRELLQLDRDTELAQAQRADYGAALAALRELDPDAPDIEAHARARAALARQSELEHMTQRAPALSSALHEARLLAFKQTAVKARVLALRDATRPADSSAASEPFSLRAELEALETELGELRERRAELERELERAVSAAQEAERRATSLESLARELAAATATLSRVSGGEPKEPWTHAAVVALEGKLLAEREALRAREGELEREREAALRRAAELESEFGGVDPELLLLRDELDAELLASRYDELEPEQAAIVQARLGDLTRALVVSNPEEAARKLAGQEREHGTVWLVGPGFFGPGEPEVVSGDAIVREGEAIRVTRLAPRPVLGRAARARRARELIAEAERLGLELEAGVQRMRRLETQLAELRAIVSKPSLFELADPKAQAEVARSEHAAKTALIERLRSELDAAVKRISSLDARVRELRGLLPDAYLLEARDYTAQSEELSLELEACERAKEELSRTRSAREKLASLIEALRTVPPSKEQLAERSSERARLVEARDRAFSLAEALADLVTRRADLAWEQAERSLSERTELVPALEEQQRKAREQLDAAEAALAQAEREWEVATSAWQKAEGEWAALEAHRAKQAQELEKEGFSDLSDSALALADELVESCRKAQAATAAEERQLATECALLAERYKQLEAIVEQSRKARAASAERARPVSAGLEALRRALAERGLERLEQEAEPSPDGSAGSLLEARTQREVLIERLSASRHGAELAAELKALFAKEATAETYLEAWLSVRSWLSRRIPAQIAQGADPLEGLERLRDHLAALERRLARQENDLRGASEDIARGVEAQLRRARNQVRRLQQSLVGLSFGNIQGIRVQMKRIERMDQILKALQKGAAQEFLFQRNLPIEEALNEVFRRYGGGKSGGARLLDYREYIELEVEIQRRGSETWEPANATRLSTGEAIGVGAALMMVILTEWERDANLFRGRRAHGSLRFLFLDEANRLSHDNLGTLFDLCKTLDLQLLIAAPEVARAEGNTTYRLVRTVTPDGREEVIVSGRRATSEAAQA